MTTALQLAAQASFNTAFLFRLTDHMAENKQFSEFVRGEYRRGLNRAAGEPIYLVNQVHMLGFAYFCLVWLWEACARDGRRNSLVNNGEVESLAQKIQRVAGDRNITSVQETLRLLRNALSHGRVQVQPQKFSFSDKGPRETMFTTAEASQEVLGELCMAVIGAFLQDQAPKED